MGFEISCLPYDIVLNQQKYCLDILFDSGLLACKPATSPWNHHILPLKVNVRYFWMHVNIED